MLLAALGALACSDLTGPPFGAEPMQAPAIYVLWWQQAQACSGHSGAFDDVDWYMVPVGGSLGQVGGRNIAGIYQPDSHRIAIMSEFLLHGSVVRHEMLHALAKEAKHERATFLGACEAVVVCESNCLTESGPAPNVGLDVPRVSAEELVVAVTVEPAIPSLASFGGRFMLVITATNPNSHDVVVVLPPTGDPGKPIGFSYSLHSDAGTGFIHNGRIHDEGSAYFTAGQVKRAVFDFQAGDPAIDDLIATGHYTASGSFSTQPAAASAGFDILP